LLRGIRRASELRKVRGLQETIGILEFHAEASRMYGELANHSDLRERPVGDFDLIVASIALSHGETLATRNTEHFLRIPELTVVRW
jgi:tRNA(fMet)-specific endonuclease VapC